MSQVDYAKIDIKYLARALVKYNASDLHLKVGRPPLYRINGKLFSAKMPEFTQAASQSIILDILTEKQSAELEMKRQIDFSFAIQEIGRFRCNVYYQKNQISAAIRLIPFVIPNLDELGVPEVIKEICLRPQGLILITGATGSGKSSTLAAMVQYINNNRQVHILTIEDPIEFTHRDRKASITQREVGSDTLNMKDAIISGLRQDPDIIMIGEIRDLETIQAALTAAETGHLVISTLHTRDARSSIDRIIDVFPSDVKNQVRMQLANNLVGVLSQQLLMRADGAGRVLACEVMIKSPTIESYMMSNELDRISEAIANSGSYYKMQSRNQALEKLIRQGIVSTAEGLKASTSPDDLKLLLAGLRHEKG